MKVIPIIAIFSLGFLSPASTVAEDSQASTDIESASGIRYEVIITPTVTRFRLRRLIEQVEDDFVARFNELNIDDAYDVLCYKHTPTMSHRRQRVCEPAFMIDARASNASEAGYILGQRGNPIRFERAWVQTPKALRRDLRPQYDTLQAKLVELTRGDKELRDMGVALGELTNRLKDFAKRD